MASAIFHGGGAYDIGMISPRLSGSRCPSNKPMSSLIASRTPKHLYVAIFDHVSYEHCIDLARGNALGLEGGNNRGTPDW